MCAETAGWSCGSAHLGRPLLQHTFDGRLMAQPQQHAASKCRSSIAASSLNGAARGRAPAHLEAAHDYPNYPGVGRRNIYMLPADEARPRVGRPPDRRKLPRGQPAHAAEADYTRGRPASRAKQTTPGSRARRAPHRSRLPRGRPAAQPAPSTRLLRPTPLPSGSLPPRS